MIDLSRVQEVLDEARDLIQELHGVELDETKALTSQSRGEARRVRAQQSQDLRRLAELFELCASLVRNEYWVARGETDYIHDRRDT